MGREAEDAALHWDAPSDPSHVDTPVDENAAAGSGDGLEGGDPDAVGRTIGSGQLVAYGVFAGIYLLFTIAWMIAGMRNTGAVGNPLGDIVYRLGVFLAVAAPPLWFIATLALTSSRRGALRLLWLFIGALILAPWPFILGV